MALRQVLLALSLIGSVSASPTFPRTRSTTTCLPNAQHGTVDRSSIAVSVAHRSWTSQQIASEVIIVVLSDLLGYAVDRVDTSSSPGTFNIGPEMDVGEYDIDMEQWQIGMASENYRTYVLARKTIEVKPVGYAGRSAIWITPGSLLDSNPDVEYYKFFQNATQAAELGFFTFGESRLMDFLGDDPSPCDPAGNAFCGTGGVDGYWMPPQCMDNPERCIEIHNAVPSYDTGYFEQLTRNLGLEAIFGYYGWGLPSFVKSWNSSRAGLFYWWEPDAFIAQMGDVRRISFPDYSEGCNSGNTRNADTGTTACDYPPLLLQKAYSTSLRSKAPEAFYVVDRLTILSDDINAMLADHIDGGGTRNAQEVACEWVKANMATVVESAPDCIVRPNPNPQTGDLVFNPAALECGSVTVYPSQASTSSCFASPPGTEDRSDQTIRLALRGWTSHNLVTRLAEIVLKEYLGYNVLMVDAEEANLDDWPAEINAGVYDIDLESWRTTIAVPGYLDLVMQRKLIAVTSIGYAGRSGLYVLDELLDQAPNSDFYVFHKNETEAAAVGYQTFASSQLRTFLGADFPVCDGNTSWCSSGIFEGYWAPPDCIGSPNSCLEVIHPTPRWDTGYCEQLTKNLDIRAIYGYYGTDYTTHVQTFVGTGTSPIFYMWEPEPSVVKWNARRISFPDYSFGCDSGNTKDPTTGTVACDFPELSLKKLVAKRIRDNMPEASLFLSNFVVFKSDLISMMTDHVSIGGAKSDAQAACDFVKNNPSRMTTYAPPCVVVPKAPQDVLIGDFVLKKESLVCEAITCPLNTTLQVVAGSFVCQACAAGTVPNAMQRACDVCPEGTAVSDNGTFCEPCAPGSFASSSGSILCEPCAVGTMRNSSGGRSCESCPVGSFQNDTGMTECLECSPGHVATGQGSSRCQACETGTYVAAGMKNCRFCDFGTFASDVGSTHCEPCGADLVTLEPGSMSAEACVCPEGSYRPEGASTACKPCPAGMTCAAGCDVAFLATGAGPHPMVEYGHMTKIDDPLFPYACLIKRDCPGGMPGTCAQYRDATEVACGVCADDTYFSEGECKKCSGSDTVPVAFAIIFGILGVVGLSVGVNRELVTQTRSHIAVVILFGLTVSGLQAISVFDQLAVDWMEPLATFLKLASVFSFNFELLKTGCITSNSPATAYVFRQVVAPLSIPIVFLVLYAKKRLVPGTRVMAQAINTVGTVFTAFFISVVVSTLSPVICYFHPSGTASSMVAYPSVLCFQSSIHSGMLTVGILAFFFFPLPFLAAVGYAVWHYPKQMSGLKRSPDFMSATRFLFVRFTPQRYYYSVIFLMRNLALCLVPVLFRGSVAMQVWASCVVIAFGCQVQQQLNPWLEYFTNLMDGILNLSLLLLLVSGALATDIKANRDSVRTAGILSFVVFCVIAVTSVFYAAYIRLFPKSDFAWFICHHKADASGQARFLKAALEKASSKRVFIDSDDLLELDTLFDIVKERVNRLVVYLTRDTMRRPWCAGEITTANVCNVKRTVVRTPFFVPPTKEEMENPGSYLDGGSGLLDRFGITEEKVTVAFQALLDSSMPCIELPDGYRGMFFLQDVVQILSARGEDKGQQLEKQQAQPYPTGKVGTVIFSCESNNNEALAATAMVVSRLEEMIARACKEETVVIVNYEAISPSMLSEQVARARAVVVFLSQGTLHDPEQLVTIVELGATMASVASPRRKSDTSEGPESNGSNKNFLPGISVTTKFFQQEENMPVSVPVSLPGCVFPTGSMLEIGGPVAHSWPGLYDEVISSYIQSFFRTIALQLSIADSDGVLSAQIGTLFNRMRLDRKFGTETVTGREAITPRTTFCLTEDSMEEGKTSRM